MTGIDKIHKWATLLGLGEKSGIDLPNEVQGLVPSPEWKQRAAARKWYAGETVSVVDRAGSVSLTPVSMAVYVGDARQRRHARDAAPAQGGRRRAAGGSRCRRRRRSRRSPLDPDKLQAIRDGLWMVVNGAGTGAQRAARRAMTSPARPARRRSSRTRARRGGQDRQGPARQRLVRVLRAARQPADRRRRVARARRPRLERRARRAPRPRHVLREEGRAAAAAELPATFKPDTRIP